MFNLLSNIFLLLNKCYLKVEGNSSEQFLLFLLEGALSQLKNESLEFSLGLSHVPLTRNERGFFYVLKTRMKILSF